MNPDHYEMVPIEVGSFVWYAGYGILLALVAALFFFSTRVGDPQDGKMGKVFRLVYVGQSGVVHRHGPL